MINYSEWEEDAVISHEGENFLVTYPLRLDHRNETWFIQLENDTNFMLILFDQTEIFEGLKVVDFANPVHRIYNKYNLMSLFRGRDI